MTWRMTWRAAVALSALLLGAGFVVAQERQTPPPQQRPPAVDPKACAPGDRLQPGSPNPSAPSATTGENLSDRLARTDGVICPPNVDPDIRAPTPDAGKTPVIPPPGSPGGDPALRPK
jgi:hypothetical protein